MSLMHPHVFAYSPSPIALYSATEYASQTCPITFRHVTKPRKFHFSPQPIETHFISNNSPPPKTYPSVGAVQTMASEGANLDAILSIVGVLCISSAVLVTISYAVNCTFSGSKRTVLEVIGSHGAFAWGMVVLVGGVAVGAWIRRRQSGSSIGVVEVTERLDLVGSVNKLEEDLKSSVTIIRVLSRQLEKLGIRFRLTRKALKEPIAETAALAQKNSEATRALAVQEDILEKELGEIQKVLLAMQEQQQKQLELILVIGKTGRLWEIKPEPSQEQDTIQSSDLNQGVEHLETHETQASGASMGTINDSP